MTDHVGKRLAHFKHSGISGCLCSHHGLVRKNGLGALQKGKRFVFLNILDILTEHYWIQIREYGFHNLQWTHWYCTHVHHLLLRHCLSMVSQPTDLCTPTPTIYENHQQTNRTVKKGYPKIPHLEPRPSMPVEILAQLPQILSADKWRGSRTVLGAHQPCKYEYARDE